MGVHGGSMDRSLSRFSVLVGSAMAVGSLSPVAPQTRQAVRSSVFRRRPRPLCRHPRATSLQVSSSRSRTSSTQSTRPRPTTSRPAVLIQLNALTSKSALLQAETFSSLITTGANQIAKRERIVNSLIADVSGASYLTGVTINGSSVSGSILALLDRVNGQLQSQAGEHQLGHVDRRAAQRHLEHRPVDPRPRSCGAAGPPCHRGRRGAQGRQPARDSVQHPGAEAYHYNNRPGLRPGDTFPQRPCLQHRLRQLERQPGRAGCPRAHTCRVPGKQGDDPERSCPAGSIQVAARAVEHCDQRRESRSKSCCHSAHRR